MDSSAIARLTRRLIPGVRFDEFTQFLRQHGTHGEPAPRRESARLLEEPWIDCNSNILLGGHGRNAPESFT